MKTSRRQFLASAAASAGAFGFPMIFSGCAAKYRANETVQVAAIGAAGRAVSNINGLAAAGARIVALCDVDTRRVGPMLARYKDAPFYRDWRRMLDAHDREVDAVMIGVPDHWHARMAVECLERGKHVQCEKPLCQSFDEMDEMLAAVRRHPELVRGKNYLCSLLNGEDGVTAKGGAGGVYAFGLREERLGVMFKLYDGTESAWQAVAARILEQIAPESRKDLVEKLRTAELTGTVCRDLKSTAGGKIGELRAEFVLNRAENP